MPPISINDDVLTPTFATVLPLSFDTAPARLMLLAIQLQESGPNQLRRQRGGSAKGLWQFEKGGGVRGVLTHPRTAAVAEAACLVRGVPATECAVYDALPTNDLLACAFARLLLYSDPLPLPKPGEDQLAWKCYTRNWRPGRPRLESWDAYYRQAFRVIFP